MPIGYSCAISNKNIWDAFKKAISKDSFADLNNPANSMIKSKRKAYRDAELEYKGNSEFFKKAK